MNPSVPLSLISHFSFLILQGLQDLRTFLMLNASFLVNIKIAQRNRPYCALYRMLRMMPKLTPVKRLI